MKWLQNLFKQNDTQVVVKEVTKVRLSEKELRTLEKMFAWDVRDETSQTRAGYQLGAAAVLRKLREGWHEEGTP